MEAHQFTTRLLIVECRERLAARVGKPRWRFAFLGIARHCDQPLQGHVDDDGFDVTESHAARGGWWFENPMLYVRGAV